ncbi:zinc-binding dehydrogenase [Leifsonia sp. AG29]|uniref:zinc-binding dehydrogenase n=1 Tax=Leifsonia sp. AG29 TaxID=2598860 RepID=UPI00131C8ADD|nr:zinc-binding dehydrogenase [Leifsonia sp. AG29]
MRAVFNAPEDPMRVAIRDGAPEPDPAPDEAIIEVHAFSLNRGELALLATRPAAWRPGQDVAGTVIRAAANGTGPAVGSRVVGLVEQAGWAERVAVAADRLAEIPSGVETIAAATLGIAGRTALNTVRLGGALLGRRVLVIGAAGGLGRFQVQLAAQGGAEVVAVSRRAGAVADLGELGADAVVSRTEDAPGLFDLVLDGVGGRATEAAVQKVAPSGTVVLIGASEREPARVALTDFFGHENAALRTYFSYAEQAPVNGDLSFLLGLLREGRLRADIGFTGPWETLPQALDALAEGRVDGKAVLTLQ